MNEKFERKVGEARRRVEIKKSKEEKVRRNEVGVKIELVGAR